MKGGINFPVAQSFHIEARVKVRWVLHHATMTDKAGGGTHGQGGVTGIHAGIDQYEQRQTEAGQ